MSAEVSLHHGVVVDRPVGEVFAYVSDANRTYEWRTEVVESRMTPAGPMRLGSALYEVAVIGGLRIVTESTIDEFEADRRFTFVHVKGMLPISGEYRVEAGPAGTEVIGSLHLSLAGGWAPLRGYLRWAGNRMLARGLATLRENLLAAVHH